MAMCPVEAAVAATEVHPTAIQGGQAQKPGGALQALRLAAMALPGLSTCLAGLSATAQAEETASLSLMHEHYSEGARNLNGLSSKFQPIQVDSLLGQARFNLTDDLSASLNLSQDTWSGATPVATAPSSARGNRVTPHSHTHTTTGASVEAGGHLHDAEEETSPTPVQTFTGASPYLYSQLTLDSQLRPLQTDSDGKLSGGWTASLCIPYPAHRPRCASSLTWMLSIAGRDLASAWGRPVPGARFYSPIWPCPRQLGFQPQTHEPRGRA